MLTALVLSLCLSWSTDVAATRFHKMNEGIGFVLHELSALQRPSATHSHVCFYPPAKVSAGRIRSSQARSIEMSDSWMFVSAKDQGTDRIHVPMSVLAPTFGDTILVGQETRLVLSRAADQLLIRRAVDAGEDIAHAVGVASTSRSSSNSQGFIAGVVATRLRILSISQSGSGSEFSCTCRAVARVRIKAVTNMLPYIIASVLPLHDSAPSTKELWARLDEVQEKLSLAFRECQQLYRAAVQRTLSSRLGALESQGFLLSLSQQDHVDLFKKAANMTRSNSVSNAPTRVGLPAAGFSEERELEEIVKMGISWQEGLGTDERLRRVEMLSFVACSAASMDNTEKKQALACTSVMDRSLMALEKLEQERDRLRALAALSGLG